MPPISIRRPVTVTTWLILSAICVLASPILLALGKLASAITRRPHPLIAAKLVLAYSIHEFVALVACGALWLGTGGGRLVGGRRWESLHWRLTRWFFAGLADAGRSVLRIDIVPEPSTEAERTLESDRPLIVLSRHAGPGDTIFIVDQLMSRFHRRPSVVFKESLALDPSIDLLGHRLPQAMLNTSDREKSEELIEQITSNLGPRGLLLLFPEGGNFTSERRGSAILHLRRRGKHASAAKAERMPHVLPPRPSGTLAALRASRGADVVFAAHTGLGRAASPGQFWRDMPIGRTFYTRMWLVEASDVPETDEDRIAWLY
ncbi:MAG: 1-acyl-sn-glycerol-3-phosphate acyltransferase, partial [Solirubrobacteraceae bacterium]